MSMTKYLTIAILLTGFLVGNAYGEEFTLFPFALSFVRASPSWPICWLLCWPEMPPLGPDMPPSGTATHPLRGWNRWPGLHPLGPGMPPSGTGVHPLRIRPGLQYLVSWALGTKVPGGGGGITNPPRREIMMLSNFSLERVFAVSFFGPSWMFIEAILYWGK